MQSSLYWIPFSQIEQFGSIPVLPYNFVISFSDSGNLVGRASTEATVPAPIVDSITFSSSPVRGLDRSRTADAVFVNTPLRNYEKKPRYNDFTLPVLGLGYIATVAADTGLNVGVLDGETLGLGFTQIAKEINRRSPNWVGFNLLAPTYVNTLEILKLLDPQIKVMLGGHLACTRFG